VSQLQELLWRHVSVSLDVNIQLSSQTKLLMKTSKILVIAALVISLVVAASLYLFSSKSSTPPPQAGASSLISATADGAIATASFYDLEEKVQPLAQWKGKVIVVNFWATWCPPCIAEIPEFIKIQKQYEKQGVQFIGIAIDQRSKVQAFAKETSMNYPVLLGDLAGIDLARRIGNVTGGLPYTVIVDRSGKVVATQLGTLSTEKLEGIIKPLL
jgi:thiol-disulfide isomerase/thioredoxin